MDIIRLWHYELIVNGLLPKSQLIAQWRELNSIFKKEDKHVLINYIYEEDKKSGISYKSRLYIYTVYVLNEMKKRGYKYNLNNFQNYFKDYDAWVQMYLVNMIDDKYNPYEKYHNDRYLLQCFYNLQEKYDRGQKDFDRETYLKLENFIRENYLLDRKEIKI